MSEFTCYLITLVQELAGGSHYLVRIALESKEDYQYWQEPDVRERLLAELPEYCRSIGPIVEVTQIFEILPWGKRESK